MAGTSELFVTFPGGRRVDTEIGGHVIRTDQPLTNGGDDSAPSPLSLFLAAIGTCAGLYVASFCQRREIATDGIRLRQRNHFDPETGVLARVELDIEVPPSFPEKYRDALVRAADGCAVKKAVQAQPVFDVKTVVAG
jgi:putative redox protein